MASIRPSSDQVTSGAVGVQMSMAVPADLVEARRALLDVLVVDSVRRTPADN